MSVILTHGANSLNYNGGGDLPANLVYLTYFNNASTLDSTIDIPVVGLSTQWNRAQSLSTLTEFVPSNYTGLPCVLCTSQGVSTTDSNLLGIINNNTGVISIEWVYNSTQMSSSYSGYGYWGGMTFGMPGGYYFGVGYNYYDTGRGIYISLPGGASSYITLESGFTSGWFDSTACCFVMIDDYHRWDKGIYYFAHVIDNRDPSHVVIRLYSNGVLAATETRTSPIVVSSLGYSNSSEWVTTEVTQFCIFNGDRSTDGGATYPVPSTPYVTSF